MAEDEMMWGKMEGSFNLLASADELDVVYLRPVSVSLTARPCALLWQFLSSPWRFDLCAYSCLNSISHFGFESMAVLLIG